MEEGQANPNHYPHPHHPEALPGHRKQEQEFQEFEDHAAPPLPLLLLKPPPPLSLLLLVVVASSRRNLPTGLHRSQEAQAYCPELL